MSTEDAGKIQGEYRADTGQIFCRQPDDWKIFAFKMSDERSDESFRIGKNDILLM
jgi:hypothetical protein